LWIDREGVDQLTEIEKSADLGKQVCATLAVGRRERENPKEKPQTQERGRRYLAAIERGKSEK
jgi:hypothetical protein